MPTIIDTLTIELNWDGRKFIQGVKETQQKTRIQRDDFEKHAKIFETMIGSLTGMVGRLAAAFLSVEAVIKGIEWTKGASAAATQYSNLAEAIGMSVKELSKWDQALNRLGGGEHEASQALRFQNQELMKRRGPSGQSPSFFLSGWWQRLGLPDQDTYWDPTKKAYDLNRLNRDIDTAMQRRPEYRTPQMRALILKDFGFGGDAAQRLFNGNLAAQLAAQSDTAMTRQQEETFRRLHGMWSDISFAAAAVGRDLTVHLEKPIKGLLDLIKDVLKTVDDGMHKHQFLEYIGPGSGKFTGGLPPGAAGLRPRPEPAPGPPPARPLVPLSTPGGAAMAGPRMGIRSPLPSPPAPRVPSAADMQIPPPAGLPHPAPRQWWPWSSGERPATFQERWAPLNTAPAAPAPAPVPAPVPPGSFEDRWSPLTKPQSRLDPQLLKLPQYAMAGSGAANAGSLTNNTRSSVSIGAMSFVSGGNADTAMGFAPADNSRQLSVAQFAVQSDQGIL